MRDFDVLDNSPLHVTPLSVADIYRREERRRDLRKHLFFFAMVVVGAAASVWAILHF